MKVYYDLHIHSCLSPCGEEEMTPNNIVNMAMIKGLDVIAVADHNASQNVAAAMQVANKRDIVVIPAMELQTSEEVHLLCLFKTLEDLQAFQEVVDQHLLGIPNNEKKFGPQLILDHEDECIGTIEHALIFSTTLTFEQTVSAVREIGGFVLPAHINRQSNGVLAMLGFIPEGMNFTTVEVSNDEAGTRFLETFKDKERYRIIRNSDAHQLMSISEREFYMELPDRNINTIFAYLEGKL